jgi:hypothetical protein
MSFLTNQRTTDKTVNNVTSAESARTRKGRGKKGGRKEEGRKGGRLVMNLVVGNKDEGNISE